MQPEDSLPRVQQLATTPHPADQFSPCHLPSYFLKIHLNIILPFMPGSSQWSLSD